MDRLRACLVVGLGVVVASGVSCKEEDGEEINVATVTKDLVDAVCKVFQSCSCDESTDIDEASDCDDAVRPVLEASTANASDLGLRYFSECLGTFEELLEAAECKSTLELGTDLDEENFEVAKCKLVAGDGGRGDLCQTIMGPGTRALGDTCRHDLACDGQFCRPFPDDEGDYCGGLLVCPPKLGCLDPDGDGVRTCLPVSKAGEKCNPHDANPCDEDLLCDVGRTECEAAPGEGEQCPLNLCSGNLVCLGNVCTRLPAVGQPCPMGQCEAQAECDFMTMTCVSLPGDGAPCPTGLCIDPFECGLDGVCRPRPAFVCSIPVDLGLCLYQGDGICDEPEGTNLCPQGTDPIDCAVPEDCPTQFDGVCDEPGIGTGLCPPGTDPDDCALVCPTAGDGVCDEPEGTGLCPEGTDPADCP